ncbi:MAG: transporter substrate-binding protein [Betaproteobacteria bacterium]|nr:transporter substrate-binding protein [Betaproteobacteria bacterium]
MLKPISLLPLAVLAFVPASVYAQSFPAKPLRMVIGFPAGSSSDVVGRLVAQKMSEGLGQQVVFENRPGAGGNIGAEFIAKSAADGYSLLYANTGLAVAVSAYDRLGYDAVRDLTPVGQAVAGPHLLIVNPALPVQSVKDLIALAKAKPRGYNVASSGNGNSDHFAYELFRSITGAEMVHVPYKGGGQASVDVIAGQMAAYFSGMAAGLPLVRGGKVKGLAVTTAQRSQIAPDIPTMIEAGVPGYEHVLWNAVLAPASTPKVVVGRLDAELAKAVNAPELRERFATLGVEPASKNAEQMTAYLKAEIEKYGKIVRAIGLKIE